MAMPIWALAASVRRSAPAISGRRSSNSEGTPAGMVGSASVSGIGGKREGRCRHANESGDGVFKLRAGDAYVDGLGLDALVLGFGLGDVDFGGDSALEAHLGELEIVGV